MLKKQIKTPPATSGWLFCRFLDESIGISCEAYGPSFIFLVVSELSLLDVARRQQSGVDRPGTTASFQKPLKISHTRGISTVSPTHHRLNEMRWRINRRRMAHLAQLVVRVGFG